MESIMNSATDPATLWNWLCSFFVIGFFVIKIIEKLFPPVKSRWERERQLDQNDEDLKDRVEKLETAVEDLTKKVGRDFFDIKKVNERTEKLEMMTSDFLTEMELLMKASLAMLEGMGEIGANGPTTKARSELNEYLNSKAHAHRP